MRKYHQKLPGTGPEREVLRQKGQFWTPDWVAEAMVAYAVADGHDEVFDPAVGAGAFFRAAKAIASESGRKLKLLGTEIDPDALQQARETGLSKGDLSQVEITDFVLQPPKGPFIAVVANPPYIRHHRLTARVKSQLKSFGANLIGKPLDGRAGLHIYFLLRALQLLDKSGRLSFIMPADTCEGVFSPTLWNWITNNYRLEAVVTFTPEASPFPGVDTNPIVFMIKNAEPDDHFLWAQCKEAGTKQLKSWCLSGFKKRRNKTFAVNKRQLLEGLTTGLSRPPLANHLSGPTLAQFAKVLRGIATGANDFFFLTVKQAAALGIPEEFLRPAVGRTRDVPGNEITPDTFKELEALDKPTRLLSLDGRAKDQLPQPIRQYLQQGEEKGLDKRALISTRRPWYKMEVRPVPPILFAYLGRRNARFIRNRAGVIPLTGFLCVYPHEKDQHSHDKLWKVLQHPKTIANLSLVAKSYGGGAIKVEPRALERLPLPGSVLSELNLHPPVVPYQLEFGETSFSQHGKRRQT